MALVREVSYEDIGGVAAVFEHTGWPPPSLRAWQRLWADNPAIDSGPAPQRGWVLEHQKRIVGFLCNLSQNYCLGERPLRTAVASALVVAPEFRGETMKLVMAFAQQSDCDLLLNTTAAPHVSKIFEFFKFRRIPQPEYDVGLFWVLRPASFLTAALRKRGWPAVASQFAGPVLVPVLSMEMALRRRGLRPGGQESSVTVLSADEIGSEFDDLWRQRLAERPRLLANRTAAALRWHYAAEGRPNPARLVCAWADSRLVGYAAIVRQDSPQLGLRRAFLADVFVERDEPETIRRLLAAAGRHARTDGAAMLEAVGFPEHIRAVFREFHPFSLRNESWPFLYSARDPDVARILADRAMWHACLFDGDGSL
jgi:hypothetical protein